MHSCVHTESVQGPCEKFPWEAGKCSLWIPLHLLTVPRAEPGALGGSAQDPSVFRDHPRAANGRDPGWERPHSQGGSGQHCWGQESSKGLLLECCLQGPKRWASVTAMFHPGHILGWQLSVKVWEQRCCAIQGSELISKAVHKTQEVVGEQQSLGAEGVCDELQRS